MTMTNRIIDPTRQGITPEEMPQEAVPESAIAGPYTLERTLALMDTWHDEMNWGLHQMCRALRAELEKTQAEMGALRNALPDIISCPEKLGLECDAYPWAWCCLARRKICNALDIPIREKPKLEFDKLGDGYVHVFCPKSGREPRMSAGCFKMEGGE